MGLSVGIVGLPNVGKSTIFNALTAAGAASANYPFCTIEPNVGIVPLVDRRLDKLADLAESKQKVYTDVKVDDIAGCAECGDFERCRRCRLCIRPCSRRELLEWRQDADTRHA